VDWRFYFVDILSSAGFKNGSENSGIIREAMSAKKSTGKLDAAIADMQGEYGEETIIRLENKGVKVLERISSGLLSVDLAIGGGWPRGRIIEVYGPPSHGKSSLMLSTAASALQSGFEALYMDAECSYDPLWAELHGVTEKIIIAQPEYGEQGLDIVEHCVQDGVDLVIVDSIEGLVPRAELEGEQGEAQMGVKARMMGQGLRKLKDAVSKSKTVLIFVNQLRKSLSAYGSPEVTPGGEALKFWASIRCDVRRKDKIKEGDKEVGLRTRVKVIKNKTSPAFMEGAFDIYTGSCKCHRAGIDQGADVLDVGIENGVIEKSGAWFSFNGERIGQGRDNASQFILANVQTHKAILEAIFAARDKK
jgi:recombination protein RecA